MTQRRIVFIVAFLLTISTFAFAQDTTCGVVWGPVIKFSPPQSVWQGDHFHPIIATQGDTIHSIWHSGGMTIFARLPYRRSTDGGITWEETRDLITDTITFPWPVDWQFMTSNSEQVNIFLVGGVNGTTSPVHLLRSNDRGTTWENVIIASQYLANTIHSADVRGDTAAAIYNEEKSDSWPRATRTTNDGETWSPSDQLMPAANEMSLALSLGLLNVATSGWDWPPGPAPEIAIYRSTNLGDTWKDSLVISDLDGAGSDYPYIVSYEDDEGCNTTIGTDWRDTKYGGLFFTAGILGRLSYDNGKTWGDEHILNTPHQGFANMITQRKNIVASVWTQEVSPWDTFRIQARISTDGGIHWNNICEVTPQSGWATRATTAISDGAVHVAWEENTTIFGRFEIYYRRGAIVLPDVTFSTSNGAIEFDSLEAGLQEMDSVGIINSGTDTLSISYVYSDSEDFSVTPSSLKIAPGSQGTFQIQFNPQNEGNLVGKLIFISNASSSPDCIAVEGTGFWHKDSVFYPISNDWQLVSKPLSLGPGEVLPSLFSYNTTYILENSIAFGKGYWAKPPSNVIYQGAYMTEGWMEINKGWNLIGSISEPVAIDNIISSPPGIVTSQFYGYGELYFFADTIHPGKAYWLKSSQNGELLLSSTSTTSMSNKIKIVPTEDIPPPPPDGSAPKSKQAIPTAYGLEQNYPNPFNSLTAIRYQIPATSWVSLRVYNILGSEVATLVNGVEEPGYKSVKFDAGRLSSGIYYYRLQAGNYVETKKLLLLR